MGCETVPDPGKHDSCFWLGVLSESFGIVLRWICGCKLTWIDQEKLLLIFLLDLTFLRRLYIFFGGCTI